MGSRGNETVNDNEMGKDVDETLNINLNDSLAEGEAKGPPLSHPGDGEAQKSTEDRELKTMDRVNVTKDAIDKKNSAAELIPSENVSEIPDVKSAETIVDDAGKASTDGNVQENATSVIVNGARNEHEDMKLNSMDNVGEGPDEVIMDVDAKENEASQLHLLDEKSSPAKFVGDDKVKDGESGKAVKDVVTEICVPPHTRIKEEMPKPKVDEDHETLMITPCKSFLAELSSVEGYESGTEEKQATFAKEVETFYRENNFEYKAPKFYKEELNLLKLWRAVIKLGGYEQVTSCKLWRQVGESFKPPKTCTTVSWTFRIFYEKALLEYEKHKMRNGELPFSDDSLTEPIRVENQTAGSQALGSGRARRDAAARAMQGWHSQRLLGNGEVCQPIIKDKNLNSTLKSEKQLKTNGVLKRKKPSNVERAVLVPHMKTVRPQMDSMVIDIGPPADWVKINVQRTNDCFEIYALVPGLLREEVHVQSDPAGRLIISGQPEQLDNPWGVTPFKKVVSLPSRIDPHQTSAVVTLHGQLFVRVPFEQSDI